MEYLESIPLILVGVMGEFVYNAISQYYTALEKLGYYRYGDVYSLLMLCFINDFVYSDYRGVLSKEDYRIIEKALSCLFGSSCLIPYPDYLKMGKLHLGEITELSHRVQAIEDTEVLKAFDPNGDNDSDIIIISDEEE